MELAKKAGELLKMQKLTVAAAESCTGGLFTSLLTDIAGSSSYVKGSVVCYTNEVKMSLCGVARATIAKFTEVSEQAALELASGIKNNLHSDIGIGITGVAGPGRDYNGHAEGLVYIAVASPLGARCEKLNFTGSRCDIKRKSADFALTMLIKELEIIIERTKIIR